MRFYQTKIKELAATDFNEAKKLALREYNLLRKQNARRQPYIRSKYFDGDKIFIALFWTHLNQKNRRDRFRRVKLFSPAIEVIRYTSLRPERTQNINVSNETLYKFGGRTKQGKHFVVQIKEHKKTGRKDFMSVFPVDHLLK